MTLYHASSHKDLTKITPQRTLSNNTYIGDFVFATANRTMALMYLIPHGFATLMNPDSTTPNIVICATSSELSQKDSGGAIYELKDESFTKTPQEGLSNYEMVSTSAAKPIRKTVYASALNALLDNGVVVRFIDSDTFNNLIGNPNQEKIISSLPVYEANT